MRAVIRVDASTSIGTGHMRRCLALTQALLDRECEVWLVSRRLDAVADSILREAPCSVLWLPPPRASVAATCDADPVLPKHHFWAQVPWSQDAQEVVFLVRSIRPDWVFVDHYAFDSRWHAWVREALDSRIAVIDDLGDRMLDADLLIDQNVAEDHELKYAGRHLRCTQFLAGPRYALISADYRLAPRYRFHPEVRSIGIFMGGSDPLGFSVRVLDACRRDAAFAGPIEIVATSASPHLAELRAKCAAWPLTRLTLDLSSLADFFSRHDLQIGAGGGATWERCCIGAPTVALVVAENQAVTLPALARCGAVQIGTLCSPGESDAATCLAPSEAKPLAQLLRDLIETPDARRSLAQSASTLVDGRGAERVALCLLRTTLSLRPATMFDAPQVYEWRNHSSLRAVSRQKEPIAYDDHERWMHSVLEDPMRHLLIAQVGKQLVGCIRFDRTRDCTVEVSLYLAPELSGLGLGSQLLNAGETLMTDLLARTFTIVANVLPSNIASQRLFACCGYTGGPTNFKKNIVHR